MKTVISTIYVDILLKEVEGIAFFTGRSRFDGNNYEQVANTQCGEEERRLIKMFVTNAIDGLKPRLPLKGLSESYSADSNLEKDTCVLEMELELNDNFDMNQSGAITRGIHEYVVNKTLGDWFGISNPQQMKIYFDKSELAYQNIRQAINKRISPLRRVPMP